MQLIRELWSQKKYGITIGVLLVILAVGVLFPSLSLAIATGLAYGVILAAALMCALYLILGATNHVFRILTD